MELEDRLLVFRSMLECCHNIYYWEYTASLDVITDNCPNDWVASMDYFFQSTFQALRDTGHLSLQPLAEGYAPILMSNSLGFFWLIQPHETAPTGLRLYVIGPLVTTDVSLQRIDRILFQHRVSRRSQEHFHDLVRQIPMISFSRCLEYAQMQYTCVAQKKITAGEIQIADYRAYQDAAPAGSRQVSPKAGQNEKPDPHGTYEAEVEMLNMVRAGDVEGCREMVSRAAAAGTLGKLTGADDYMRQMKNTSEVCVILFSRAAIEGGVPPETALNLTDHYYQEIESCTSLSDLIAMTKTMQLDFVERVHVIRTGGYTRPITACLDYISAHLEDDITLSNLCAASGYTRSHFLRRFRAETGKTPLEYVQDMRLSRAADLLRHSPSTDIGDIAFRFRFCSQSYFAERFHRKYGVSPSQYRKDTSGPEISQG